MSDIEEALASKFRRLVELREKRDETKTSAENAEKAYREYESELFDEIEEGPLEGAIKIDLGPPYGKVTFSQRTTHFGRIIDAEAALEYFEQRAMTDEMTRPTISKGRLNEIIREHLEQGKPLPDGTDFYTNRGITISRK